MACSRVTLARRVRLTVALAACLAFGHLQAQVPAPADGARFQVISEADLETWLTYLAADELAGRQVFTEGYGIAAQYIAERLREFGVEPIGENGSYFQMVKLQSYDVARGSSVTIEANGQKRTFKDGDHVAFPAASGGRQTLVFEGAQIVSAARAGLDGLDVKGKLIVLAAQAANGRTRVGVDALLGAVGSIERVSSLTGPRRPDEGEPRADIPPDDPPHR